MMPALCQGFVLVALDILVLCCHRASHPCSPFPDCSQHKLAIVPTTRDPQTVQYALWSLNTHWL